MPSSHPSRFERSADVLAFGHAPDWSAVIGAVRDVTLAESNDPRVATAERGREALVITFAFFLAADTPGRLGARTRTTLRALATVAALREERVRSALHTLVRAGVLQDHDGGALSLEAAPPVWDETIAGQIAPDVLRPAPAAHVLRWDALRERAGGSTRALVATAAFLDLLPVPGEWTTVALSAVGAITQYTGRKVGEAVQRAVACGVVDERRERGSANLYRFASAVLRGGSSSADAPARTGVPARPRQDPGAPSPGIRAATGPDLDASPSARATAMRPVVGAATLMVGGVPLPLPPGAQPQLEVDAEGRFWYRVGTLHFGPVRFD